MKKMFCFEEWQTYQITSSRYSMVFARNVASKINRDVINYIDAGSYGSAYRIDGYKVMKITTDEREAFTANRLIGENTENLVRYYEVYELESLKITKPTYVIIMEFLITLFEYPQNVRDFFDYFSVKYNQEDFFKYNNFIDSEIIKFKDNYFEECSNCLTEKQVFENIEKLKKIAIDTKKYNIYPVDAHSGNFGFRIIDKDLIYFDVGVNKNYTKTKLEKIIL